VKHGLPKAPDYGQQESIMKQKTKDKAPEAKPPRLFAATSAQEIERFRSAKQEWSRQLLTRAPGIIAARALTVAVSPDPERNVQGVGIGEKLVDGKAIGMLGLVGYG
jgi:hypothetical protein